MINVMLILIVFFAAVSAFLFHTSMFWTIAAAAAAIVLLALKKLFRKSKLVSGILSLGGIAVLAACILIPQRTEVYGFYDYAAKYEKLKEALESGDTAKANSYRKEISKTYGDTDAVLYLNAVSAFAQKDYETAQELADRFEDRHSKYYYLTRELLLMKEYGERRDEDPWYLRDLYQEAAEWNPDWIYAQKCAGGMLFDNKEYEKAAYYLTRAYDNMSEADPEILYYLGAVMYEMKHPEKAWPLFLEALEAGADETTVGNIAWYYESAGMEVQE